MTNLTYSNPRLFASINNWPSGQKRVVATFTIEQTAKGERAVRITTGAPKKLTYARRMRIVDGSDGKTYIAALSDFGSITIFQGNMQYNQETIGLNDPRYAAILATCFHARLVEKKKP